MKKFYGLFIVIAIAVSILSAASNTAVLSQAETFNYDCGVGNQAVIKPASQHAGVVECVVAEPTATPFQTPTASSTPTLTPTSTSTPVTSTVTPTATITPTATPEAGANLIQNPCFEGGDRNDIVWEPWVPDDFWHRSGPKASNPCKPEERAARFGYDRNNIPGGEAGDTAYIYQVVSAEPNATTLYFNTWHILDQCHVRFNIYGGQSDTGPWQLVWRPYSLTTDQSRADSDPSWTYHPGDREWYEFGNHSTIVTNGWPYYKVEIEATMIVDDESCGKWTDIYFSAE